MNDHSLSDFRSLSEEQFEDVIVQIVGSLMNAGLVSLKRLAQDGMKVRASDTPSRIIAGDQVTNAGTEHGQLGPIWATGADDGSAGRHRRSGRLMPPP